VHGIHDQRKLAPAFREVMGDFLLDFAQLDVNLPLKISAAQACRFILGGTDRERAANVVGAGDQFSCFRNMEELSGKRQIVVRAAVFSR